MSLIIPLISSIIASGGILLFGRASELKDVSDNLSYKVKVESLRFHTLTEIRLAVRVVLVNPTNVALKMKGLFVNLTRRGTSFTMSQTMNSTIEVKAQGETTLPTLNFSLSPLTFLSDAIALIPKLTTVFKTKGSAAATAELNAHATEILKNYSIQIKTTVNNMPLVVDEPLAGTETFGTINLGYAPVSAIDRKIQDGSRFEFLFPKPKGKKERIIKDASIEQTVFAMTDVVNKDAHLIKEASEKLFRAKTVQETAKKLFDWIFKYIKYNLEEGEQLRNPLMVYHLGQRLAFPFYKKHGYFNRDYSVDCDDISIFVAAVLKNLGIPYIFRITSYADMLGVDRGFSHVYVLIPMPGEENIIIDPVYFAYNSEKQYARKQDYDMNKNRLNGTDVYYLSGINAPLNGNTIGAIAVLNGSNTDTDRGLYEYLVNSYNQILQNPQANTQALSHDKILEMYKCAIDNWYTPNKIAALERLEQAEDVLIRQGYLKAQGLSGSGKLKSFFSKVKNKAIELKQKHGGQITGKQLSQSNYATPAAKAATNNANQNATNTGSQTTKKTVAEFVKKHKYPIAIGTGLGVFGLVALYVKKQKNKTAPKQKTTRRASAPAKLSGINFK